MVLAPLKLRADYWENFEISEDDLDFVYNYLLELETPQTPKELALALIAERIRREKEALKSQQRAEGRIYMPKEHYSEGQSLIFPALNWAKGTVKSVRKGRNPQLPPFEVIRVEFNNGEKHEFAAGLEDHRLNQPVEVAEDDEQFDHAKVFARYGDRIASLLEQKLEANPDLVRIAGRWFPRALLVDVNIGYLNLAEAVLDETGGGPLPTKAILDQIELPTDVNLKLTEFSLNLALQEDPRFDEVGPAGEVLWFLNRLEPEGVRNTPRTLRFSPQDYDRSVLTADMLSLEAQLDDELSPVHTYEPAEDEVSVCLIYPHWHAGTLPLTDRVRRLFPTAYEAPRVRFTFVFDGETFPGWVVRPNHYVYGLRDWYTSQGLIPGNFVRIRRGKKPGEVEVSVEKRRSTREWIRTVLIGADGGIVFAMLKQTVTASFDERMVIAIPDDAALESAAWETSAWQKVPLDKVITDILRELAKLTPQGNVHAQELYAAVNVVRRCPPGLLFARLATDPKFIHVGDLYYRLSETVAQEGY